MNNRSLICYHADVSTNYFTSVYNSFQIPLFFLHANVRSLNKNMDKLEDLLHSLPTSPHITAVTANKLKANNSVSNIPGYRFIYKNSHTNSGEVGMYVKQGIFFTVRNYTNLNNSLVEDTWIDAKLNESKSSTILSVIYIFSSTLISSNVSGRIGISIRKFKSVKQKVFIMGDFNINLLQKSQAVVNYLRSLTSLGLISLIDCPTRLMLNQTPSLLDHIYTNQHDKTHFDTIAFPISGHHPTYALIENGFKKCPRPPIYKWYGHNLQVDDYITDLSVAMQELL